MKKIAILFFVLSLLILPSLGIASTPVENYNASIEAGDINGAAQAEADINAIDPSGITAASVSKDQCTYGALRVAEAKLRLVELGKIDIVAKTMLKMPILHAASILSEMAIMDLVMTAEVLLEAHRQMPAEAIMLLLETHRQMPVEAVMLLLEAHRQMPAEAIMLLEGAIREDLLESAELILNMYYADPSETLMIMGVLADVMDVMIMNDVMNAIREMDPNAAGIIDPVITPDPGPVQP